MTTSNSQEQLDLFEGTFQCVLDLAPQKGEWAIYFFYHPFSRYADIMSTNKMSTDNMSTDKCRTDKMSTEKMNVTPSMQNTEETIANNAVDYNLFRLGCQS